MTFICRPPQSLERHDGRSCTKRQRRVARSSLKCGTQADVQAQRTLRLVMSIVVTFHSYSVRARVVTDP